MKKVFENPEMEVKKFEKNEVIVASGGIDHDYGTEIMPDNP